MQIRKALPIDALGITIVNVYTWKTQYTGLLPDELIDLRIREIKKNSDSIKERIENGTNYYVALEEDTIVGFCSFGKSREEEYKDYGEIYAIYNLEGFKGNGIGRSFFDIAIKYFKEQGFEKFIVKCLVNNPSEEFYKHMGGEIISKTQIEKCGFKIDENIFVFDVK